MSLREEVARLVAEASPGPWLVGYKGWGGDEVWSKPCSPETHWHDADLLFVPSQPRGTGRQATACLACIGPLAERIVVALEDEHMLATAARKGWAHDELVCGVCALLRDIATALGVEVKDA